MKGFFLFLDGAMNITALFGIEMECSILRKEDG